MAQSRWIRKVECEVNTLAGGALTLMVQLDWKVAKLKERVEGETSLPYYLQILSTGDRIMHDTEELRDVYNEQSSANGRLCVFLACMHVPDQLGQTDVQRAWEAFRMHSTDYSDTIPQTSVFRVIHFSGLSTRGCRVEDMLGGLDPVSFTDLLSVMATVKDTSSRHALEEFVSEPYPFATSDYAFAQMDVVSSSDDIPVVANPRRSTRCFFLRKRRRKRTGSSRSSKSTRSFNASSSERCQDGSCARALPRTHAHTISL
eukprot:TRINITY_DN4148_c0_g1_i2.p1 TRINITY_DN4148_c0_g1~~TRINITY_DN4148_c0_g1_i2.p1  ORF type:complete len:259 (+),score=12.00 TRINITY_DN4148_c0_g1_i2:48-824(+)